MTSTKETIDPVIFAADGVVDWKAEADARGPYITKIAIGKLGSDDDRAKVAGAAIPTDLATLFPQLTHLYLWNVIELNCLPQLPPALKCLDVRDGPDLARLTTIGQRLPVSLDTLIVERCQALAIEREQVQGLAALQDVSLRGCLVTDDVLKELLAGAQRLRFLDARDCQRLTRIDRWPPKIVDIRLDGCQALKILPGRWPASLRRIGLRRARAIQVIPDFPPSLDYIDLAFTESLKALPRQRGTPRTLFLFGSGVLVPPASEHGKTAETNVAERTDSFFSDVELTGTGHVRRCKVLVLGNGDAGKTCLSLAIDPAKDPREAKRFGSTHGVQLRDWLIDADIDQQSEAVHVHLWDFGGQEIYHNTHSLFMGKGAVFVVVWKPEQDGEQPQHSGRGYQDEWRRLQYWIDFIRLACPHSPRIAVICSHHPQRTDELVDRFRSELRPQDAEVCALFFVDSLERTGEIEELRKWIRDEVQDVVATQGTAVPTYWEVAQEMVEGWLQRLSHDATFAAGHNQIDRDRFRDLLTETINDAVSNDTERRLATLDQAIKSGEFALDDDRVRRTLEFLTNSGWLYWDPELIEGRVIVGQQWALDGIYAVLDRRPGIANYDELLRRRGRFSQSYLNMLCWANKYTEKEQSLLCSFMVRCGVAFRLRRAEDAWRDEDVYATFEHLPDAGELSLRRKFERCVAGTDARRKLIKDERLHRLHWQAFLTDAGDEFGGSADYANDGFYVESKEGNHAFISAHFDADGLGGEIEVRVAGEKADDLLDSAIARLQRFLPSDDARAVGRSRADSPHDASLGTKSVAPRVFISYAWDYAPELGKPAPTVPYEAPVNAIEKLLLTLPVRPVRDRSVNKQGVDLRVFMLEASRSDFVIIVHSDKYLESPNCIFELKALFDELTDEEAKSFAKVAIPIEHPTSGIADRERLEKYLQHWTNYQGEVPQRLGWEKAELIDFAKGAVRGFSKRISGCLDINIRWKGDGRAALAAIESRLPRRA